MASFEHCEGDEISSYEQPIPSHRFSHSRLAESAAATAPPYGKARVGRRGGKGTRKGESSPGGTRGGIEVLSRPGLQFLFPVAFGDSTPADKFDSTTFLLKRDCFFTTKA
jgi:hypothetical protein